MKNLDSKLKNKLNKISDNADFLTGEKDMIELNSDNEKHVEWFEDDSVFKDYDLTLSKYKNRKAKTMTREEHIERLEASMAKWRARGLDKSMPDSYEDFMNELQALKDGVDYRVLSDREGKEELATMIGFVGGKFPEINYTSKGKLIPVKNPITLDKARKSAREILDISEKLM